MNCVSGQKGQFLCINRNCQVKNCFVCSDPQDVCKQSHQCCSLISLTYLLKKSRIDNNPKNKQNRYDKLVPIYDKAKTIATTINNALASFNIIKQINNLLEQGNPLTPDDKDKIAKFMSDRKIQQAQDNIYMKIQKQLQQFQTVINQFQLNMKQLRNKQIQQLRKKLDKEQKGRVSQMPLQSRIEQFEGPKSTKKLSKNQNLKSGEDLSPIRNMKSEIAQKVSSPKKSKVVQKEQTPVRSNVLIKQQQSQKKQKDKQRREEKIDKQIKNQKVKPSQVRPRPNEFQQKITAILKNHVPKPPLFSKITNDTQTLNSFFQQNFQQARLLYRASENQYLVSAFHEKCDGHKFTLTLVLTEFDKVIGGYTPLPWKAGGGEWYGDKNKKSFIFNLTSGEKYPLLNEEKAIWCSKTYGPSFGHPDLQIADKAFYNSNSCANFPNCYNNGNYKNTPGSTQLFCGTKNGHFRIKQWEVYELTFI